MTFSSNRHPALAYCWSMIFSENRYPLFGIMLWLLEHDLFRKLVSTFRDHALGIDGATSLQIERGQEFLPRLRLRPEDSQHAAHQHRHIRLVHAACRHELVGAFDDDTDAEWIEHALQTAGDLGGHFFLHLQPSGIDVDEPRQFRNADNAVARQIADVNAADDRRDMVLAMGLEPDVAQHDDLVVAANLLEGPLQVFARILEIARKPVLVSPHDARRSAEQSFAFGIIPGPANERAHGLLGGLAGRSVRGFDHMNSGSILHRSVL